MCDEIYNNHDEIYNNHIIANCPQNVPRKEFVKSVIRWGKTMTVKRADRQQYQMTDRMDFTGKDMDKS